MIEDSSPILSLLRQGRARLEEHGVPNAARNAQWILCHVLRCQLLDLFLERVAVKGKEIDLFQRLLARRARREPLQYILESTEFMSLSFKVRAGVFIPRFETEILVEKALAELDAKGSGSPVVLDLGTGAGVIAISMARLRPDLNAVGVDVSAEAVRTASENAHRLGVEARTEFVEAEASEYLASPGDAFDLIASNPPYIAETDWEELPPEVREFEPRAALAGGEDGLAFYRKVCPLLPRRLKGGGMVFFETSPALASTVGDLLVEAGLSGPRVLPDYAGKGRVVAAEAADG